MRQPVEGKEYSVVHVRKGAFIARLIELGEGADPFDTWELISGEAKFLTEANARPGDRVTIRRSLYKVI